MLRMSVKLTRVTRVVLPNNLFCGMHTVCCILFLLWFYGRQYVSNQRQLNCLFNSLFRQSAEGKQHSTLLWPFVREILWRLLWFPLLRATYAKCVPIHRHERWLHPNTVIIIDQHGVGNNVVMTKLNKTQQTWTICLIIWMSPPPSPTPTPTPILHPHPLPPPPPPLILTCFSIFLTFFFPSVLKMTRRRPRTSIT